MSRIRAADDADTIAARLRELEAERIAAWNRPCEHDWSALQGKCLKCGTPITADPEWVTG